MPVVAVFAADVHAADERDLLVDDRRLDVVSREPRVGHVAHLHVGVALEVHAHRRRVFVVDGQRLRVGLHGEQVADAVHHDADAYIVGARLEAIGKIHGEVIVVEDIGADIDAFFGAVDGLCQAIEVLVAINQEADPAQVLLCASDAVERLLEGGEVHGFDRRHLRNRAAERRHLGGADDDTAQQAARRLQGQRAERGGM